MIEEPMIPNVRASAKVRFEVVSIRAALGVVVACDYLY
jgi:hypothetical protein